MAIIFVSAKKKQKMFFWSIIVLLILILAVISFMLVLPEFKNLSDVVVHQVYSAPDVKVNFTVIDSPQVKNLEPFTTSAILEAPGGRPNPFSP